jgi:hypothetical protein
MDEKEKEAIRLHVAGATVRFIIFEVNELGRVQYRNDKY